MTIEAGQIIVWVLVFVRTGAFFMGIPLFSGKMLPTKTKIAFGLLLSLMINPLVPANLTLATNFAGAILLALNEVCIGLLPAMTVRMVFFAVELAGYLISYEIGLMASNSVNLSGFLRCYNHNITFYFSMLIFFVTGIHYDVLKAFIMSFEILPIGSFLLSINPMNQFVGEVSRVFLMGTLMAAPSLLLIFLSM